MTLLTDFKRGLKSVWADAAQGIKPSFEVCEAIYKHPFRRMDPLIEALAYLTLKETRFVPPPLSTRAVLMPVPELCQLALLWAFAQETEAASSLAHSIPLDFPWLWTPEGSTSEEDAALSVQILRNALGKSEGSLNCKDPYFQALASRSVEFHPVEHPENPFNSQFIGMDPLKGCLAFSGARTSLGAIVSGPAQIRAFGPQAPPLSDPAGFGIRSAAPLESRWASPSAYPEVWFEVKNRGEEKALFFDLSFYGLKPSAPLVFSFYVKAGSAEVGAEKVRAGTLQRYQGLAKPVVFSQSLRLESSTPGKLEVIPLSGSGGYWGCEYLAAFEIHPINAKMSFSISIV